ncbi:MAG: hypothetical protein HY911_01170 [Desulfobacterales bacterium]|nr:hypothetical protein [Desulfobacterales bacterium]
MIAETPKRLPENLGMPCYACESRPATHVCRYKIDELGIQVCLCSECMQIDTQRLLKSTIGIQDVVYPSASNYLVRKSSPAARPWQAERIQEGV